MKHFIAVLFLVFSLGYALADSQPSTSDSKELKGVTLKDRATSNRPMHAPTLADIVLVIQDDQCIVYFSDDYGTGTYRISDGATGATITSTVNTSLVNYLSIPIHITDSSDMDFYIEFEDRCWCHLVWNQFDIQ